MFKDEYGKYFDKQGDLQSSLTFESSAKYLQLVTKYETLIEEKKEDNLRFIAEQLEIKFTEIELA